MARTKTSTRKSNTAADHEHYTAELSTGQLVIGMSIMLMIGLACFLMGVVVGKFDPSLNPELAQQAQPVQTRAQAALPPARQFSPPTDPIEPVARSQNTPAPELRVPRTTEQAKAPAVTTTPKETVQVKETPPPTQTKPSTPISQAEPKDSVETPEKSASASIPEIDASKTLVNPPKPKPTTPEISPAGPPRSAVQIMAFRTRQRAELVKRDVETRSSYSAKIVSSASGRLFKVVVGSYADRESAVKARDDLKQNFGFTDCFVTKLQ